MTDLETKLYEALRDLVHHEATFSEREGGADRIYAKAHQAIQAYESARLWEDAENAVEDEDRAICARAEFRGSE